MKSLIKKHINTNRTPVSDASNDLVSEVAEILNGKIIKSRSGSEVLTWIIPEYFKCHKAVLKRLNGDVIADFNKHPLYLWTNSINFKGRVSRSELESHIMTDKTMPDAVPYHYKQGFHIKSSNWGFSIPYNVYKNLNDEEYDVDIEVELNNDKDMFTGVAEAGSGGDTYIFAAHTCHPGQATDGLTNVALLVEIFKTLQKMDLKNTYKFIFGPEYYAAAAFLNQISGEELKKIKGGFFLDLIGGGLQPAFSTSFQGNTFVDKVVEHVFTHKVNDYEKRGYREIVGNDEMFYNGPYYNIPTVTLGEILPKGYHSNDDNYENINFESISQYYNIIMDVIKIFENNSVPILKYKGPLCLSRYNIFIDIRENRNAYRHIEALQILTDGKKSYFDLALDTGADFDFVLDFYNKLIEKKLVSIDKKD